MNKIAEMKLKKIANILVYFASKTENFGLTKANKLLYYLDCYHLLRYGRTVTRDKYRKRQFGAVPENIYNILSMILESNCLSEAEIKESNLDNNIIFEYINVIPEKFEPEFSNLTIGKIIPKKDFEPIWLSDSEIEIMKELAEKYYSTTAREIVRINHRELPFNATKDYEYIDLKLFLKDNNMPQNDIDHIAHIEKEIESIALNYQGY